MYPLERVHVVTGFIIYTYVCNKNSLFVNPPKYTLLPPPPLPHAPPKKKIALTTVRKCYLEYCIFPKAFEDNTRAKFGGQTECIKGDWKIVN